MAEQGQQHKVLGQTLQPQAYAFEHTDDVVLQGRGLPHSPGLHLAQQLTVVAACDGLDGTAHLLRWLRFVEVLGLTLLHAFLGSTENTFDLGHAALGDDVLYPLERKEQLTHALHVAIEKDDSVRSHLQRKLVARAFRGTVGQHGVDIILHGVAEHVEAQLTMADRRHLLRQLLGGLSAGIDFEG